MAGAKSKITPAVPAEGETPQNDASQENQQQAVDPAASQEGLPPTDTVDAGDNQVQQEPAPEVEQQAAQAPATADAVAGLFEPNAIEVAAKCESFRRAGRVFSREVSTIRLAELTEAEFKMLYEEPMLAVKLTYLAEED